MPVEVLDVEVRDNSEIYCLVLCTDDVVEYFHFLHLMEIAPHLRMQCINLLAEYLNY